MSNHFSNLKAVIFDLGGVIIDHDDIYTREAFQALSNLSPDKLGEVYQKEPFFQAYEVGEIDDDEFRANIRQSLRLNAEDEAIDSAWNAMLRGGINADKFEVLDRMAHTYDLYVMSNTNSIHVHFFERLAKQVSGRSFSEYFKKVYYSHELGERKPNPGAWQVIIDEQELNPAEALFIDDKLENCIAAKQLGLQTYHNQQPRDWMQFF